MKEYCFGVDVGGTTVKIGFFKSTGELLDKWEIHTDKSDDGSHILSDIGKSLDQKLKKAGADISDLEGVGIGVPGPVLSDGTVLGAVNLGWGEIDVEETMSKLYHNIRIEVGNDANVAALGEACFGSGRGYNSLVMITLGTGVGGGIVIDGKIYEGSRGSAGEFGHMIVNKTETDRCSCGNYGCLEQYTSARGISRLAGKYLKNTAIDTRMRDIEDRLNAKNIFDLAKEGDQGAMQVTAIMEDYLSNAMAAVASVINPEVFIIGGGVSKAGDFLIDALAKGYKRYAFPACRNADVKLAELSNDAGIYGAAAMVIR